MSSKQPSFADRVQRMHALANDLCAMGNLALKFGDEVAAEAAQMDAAAQRYAERHAGTRKSG